MAQEVGNVLLPRNVVGKARTQVPATGKERGDTLSTDNTINPNASIKDVRSLTSSASILRTLYNADGLVSSVDLVPTMLRLIDQPIPDGLQGRDYSELARGKRDTGRDYVFIENIPYPFNRDKGEERCVMDERYKLILSTVRPPEVIDLERDPDEKNNYWDEMKAGPVVKRLMDRLEKWGRDTNDALTPKLIAAVRK